MTELSEAQQKAVDTVAKLLALAGRAGTPAEAAAAANKAQELLEAHNLTQAAVEAATGKLSGKRAEEAQAGGMYEYQRRLWHQVAELNFCLYVPYKERYWSDKYERYAYRHKHKLVGRVENVAAAQALGGYLQEVMSRLCMERLHGQASQFFSRWAISFREGVTSEVCWRLYERRRQRMSEQEAARKAELERMSAGASTATALTLRDVEERERDANQDFLWGEGFSARRAEQRARRAAAQAAAEAEYTRWAEANPKEAAREEEKRRRRQERQSRQSFGRERPKNWGAYKAGREVGKSVSIDPQVGDQEHRRIGRGR